MIVEHPRTTDSNSGKVLVTGSHGVLGNVFVELLTSRGHAFQGYDRRLGVLEADIESIVHFGGITPVSSPGATWEGYRKANIEGTRKLLDQIAGCSSLKRFINIGSASEYGAASGLIGEGAPAHPASDYGRSKLAQSALVEEFSRLGSVSVWNFRIFNILSLPLRKNGAQTPSGPTVVGSILDQLKQGDLVHLKNQDIVRDFLDLRDVADAVLLALTAPSQSRYELVNIATGTGTSLGELAKILGQLVGRSPELVDELDNADRSIGDPRKAERLLGWKSRIPVSESLEHLVRIYRSRA